MARPCSIDTHAQREAIDAAARAATTGTPGSLSLRRVAASYGVSDRALRRHLRQCVGKDLREARADRERRSKRERAAKLGSWEDVLRQPARIRELAVRDREYDVALRAVEVEIKARVLMGDVPPAPSQQQANEDVIRIVAREVFADDAPLEASGRPRRGGRTIDVSPTVVDERPALPPGEVDPEPDSSEDEFKRRLAALNAGRSVDDEDDEDEALDELEPRSTVYVPAGSAATIVGGRR